MPEAHAPLSTVQVDPLWQPDVEPAAAPTVQQPPTPSPAESILHAQTPAVWETCWPVGQQYIELPELLVHAVAPVADTPIQDVPNVEQETAPVPARQYRAVLPPPTAAQLPDVPLAVVQTAPNTVQEDPPVPVEEELTGFALQQLKLAPPQTLPATLEYPVLQPPY